MPLFLDGTPPLWGKIESVVVGEGIAADYFGEFESEEERNAAVSQSE
jgi:hypothetical protein